MKVLIVSKCPTHPTNAGNRRYILSQVELYREFGYEVSFLYIHESPLLQDNYVSQIESLNEYWNNKLFIYKISKLQKIKINLIKKIRDIFFKGRSHCDDSYPYNLHKMINNLHKKNNFDCCIINYYNISKTFNYIKIPLKGLITHDYFSYKDLLINKRGVFLSTTANEEAKAMQRSPHIFALNEEEKIFFQKLSPQSRVYNIYSIYNYYSQPICNNFNILFLSGKNMFNIEGLEWFVDQVLPKIIQKFPKSKLIVGGGICESISYYKDNPNIELHGFIEDVYNFYLKGDVAINPTMQGTGLKIKTFEAISYDKITMVHPHSTIGIFDKENAPLFASTNPNEWVDFLSKIWLNPKLCSTIKSRNMKYIRNMKEHIVKEYDSFFKQKK